MEKLKVLYKSLMQYCTCNSGKVEYKRVIELVKILVKLLTLYFRSDEVKDTFESTIVVILD